MGTVTEELKRKKEELEREKKVREEHQVIAMQKLSTQINDLTNALTNNQKHMGADLVALVELVSKQESRQKGLEDSFKKLHESIETLATTIANNKEVKLSDGKTVKTSDLEALSLVNQLSTEIKTLNQSFKGVQNEVRRKSQVTFDSSKVGEFVTSNINKEVKKASLEVSKTIVESWASSTATTVEKVSEKLNETEQSVKNLSEKLNNIDQALDKIENKSTRFSKGLTIKSLAAGMVAFVPYAIATILILGLVIPIAQVTGIPAIAAWSLSMFMAAQWWVWKLVIAIAHLIVVALVGWGVFALGKAIYDKYQYL